MQVNNQSHHSFSLLIHFIDLSTALYQHEQSRPSSHSESTSGKKMTNFEQLPFLSKSEATAVHKSALDPVMNPLRSFTSTTLRQNESFKCPKVIVFSIKSQKWLASDKGSLYLWECAHVVLHRQIYSLEWLRLLYILNFNWTVTVQGGDMHY